MRIEHPTEDRIPALRTLWQDTFGDDASFLDAFFATGFAPERCLCVLNQNRVAAALYWLDMTCRGRKLAYIYAVATDQAHRKQGFCRALMARAHEILVDRGYSGSMLVPARDTLAAMYAKYGYSYCTTISRFERAVGLWAAPGRLISKEEYLNRRETMLPGGGVQLGQGALDFLASQAFFFAGSDYLMAGRKEGQTLCCLELLGDPDAAPGILNTLELTYGSFRSPGDGKPFAMYRPIDLNLEAPTYLGFAFD